MAAPIILPILSIFKSAGLNQARTALLGASKDFGDLAGSIGKAAGAFSAFSALAGAQAFTLESVELTQRYERNLLALQQVFETMTPEMRRFGAEVEAYGLSQSQAAQSAVFLGSVLKQYGFTVEESAGQTQKLIKLAQDLAVTYGYDVQEALLAITALFRGEYDPIEKFGVAMKQNEVNARVAADGMADLEGAALANAQAQARLTMLFERAGDSMGAFERASNTLYAAQQRVAAGMQNLQIAFGAPLQEPLAAVQNAFADIIANEGPGIIDIGEALGGALEALSPAFINIAQILVELIQPLEQLINIVAKLLEVAFIPLNIVLDLVGSALSGLNKVLDLVSLGMSFLETSINKFLTGAAPGLQAFLDDVVENSKIIQFFISLSEELGKGGKALDDFLARQENNKLTETSRDMAMLENATRNFGKVLGDTVPELSTFETALQEMGRGAEEAKDTLTGLDSVLYDIEEATRKSEVSEAFKEIGFSASQIEYFLTKPDWYNIFNQISRLAKLAALDVNKAFSTSLGGSAMILNAQAELKKLLDANLGGGSPDAPSSPAKKAAKDYVKAFTNGIREEAEKQSAATQLATLGASAGLIEKILNTDGWKKVWLSIKNGTLSVKELQKAFNATADGARELQDASEAAAEAAERQAEAARNMFIMEQERIAEIVANMRELEKELKSVAVLDMMPSQAEMGQYEASVSEQFKNIKSTIQKAFDNKAILREAYDELMAYADREQTVLQGIARQRDDVAERYNLAKALIEEYQGVFRGALNLTSLLNTIESKSKKVTVTQFTEGVVKMGNSLKGLRVTLTKEWEEQVEETINKSQGLVQKFQEMATKARAFAENLRTLRDMGLNPMLFNQLVQAGVEAGGETAQALVDGGKATVDEVSGLFAEIDALGATLGEEVARSLYGDGVDMSKSLLEGLKSLESQYELAGISLAKAFTTKFNEMVTDAVGKAIAALQNVAQAPGAPQVSTGTDVTGMPQVIIAPQIPIQMPSTVIVPEGTNLQPNPFTPVPGGSPFAGSSIVINVKTDATQSNAIVGKTIGNVLTSYVKTGGMVAI